MGEAGLIRNWQPLHKQVQLQGSTGSTAGKQAYSAPWQDTRLALSQGEWAGLP